MDVVTGPEDTDEGDEKLKTAFFSSLLVVADHLLHSTHSERASQHLGRISWLYLHQGREGI